MNQQRGTYENVMAAFYAETERPSLQGGNQRVSPDWAIDIESGRYLYDLVRQSGFSLTMEIGLCEGASAMHIACAHRDKGAGFHIAVDPHQISAFQGVGVLSVSRFGLLPWFRLIERRSDTTLPMLQHAGLAFDMVFIDGDHRFDAVFQDFYFADRLLNPNGGMIVFDEAHKEGPTWRVASFIEKNLPNYQRTATPDRFFGYRKVGHDKRNWEDKVDF